MLTLWGRADDVHRVSTGIYVVGTPSHGGLLVGKLLARKHLSEKTQAIGEEFGSWLAYEEDCNWAVITHFPQGDVENWRIIGKLRSKRWMFMPYVLTNWNSFWTNNEGSVALYRDQAVSKLQDSENPPVNTPSVVCKRLAATLS